MAIRSEVYVNGHWIDEQLYNEIQEAITSSGKKDGRSKREQEKRKKVRIINPDEL